MREAAGGSDAEAWSGAEGRFCAQLLEETAPDFRTLDTYLCGPPAFMRNVVQVLEKENADLSRLRFERFSTAVDASMFSDQVTRVRFVRSGSESVSNRPSTLLEQIESAGIPLATGCRAGNCGTCRSRKLCGVVVDVTTGLESGPGEQFIYPCVSVARGSVEMDSVMLSTAQRTTRIYSAKQNLDDPTTAFGREIEALRREVELQLGADDAAHIRAIGKLSRKLEITGRSLSTSASNRSRSARARSRSGRTSRSSSWRSGTWRFTARTTVCPTSAASNRSRFTGRLRSTKRAGRSDTRSPSPVHQHRR